MQRYFLYLAYNGTRYHGWQVQPNGVTVQERIEEALALLLRRETPIVGAGRTDAGVHARLMVAHFDTEEALPDLLELREKLNRVLPSDISIYKIVPVRADAHSRFDALSRTYRYYLIDRKNCRIMKACWKKENDLWVFEIKADRFLRNMVRAIVGTLYDVGRGRLSVGDFCRVIEDKNRCKAGTSAPGNALFLVNIEYPEEIFDV